MSDEPMQPLPASASSPSVLVEPHSTLLTWGVSESIALWAMILPIALVDAIWVWRTGMKLTVSPAFFAGAIFLVAVGILYARIRPDKRLGALALTFLQLALFTIVFEILSYMAASASLPLVDATLAAADTAMGIGWLSLFNWVKARPMIDLVSQIIYDSAIFQILALVVTLNALGRLDRARQFLWAFVFSLMLIVPLSWLFPAAGAWSYYGVADRTSAYYLPEFFALRAGTMSAIDLTHASGIIQFPSFHATLALILIMASRGTFLFPIFLPLNLLMIASSASSGGHHVIDLIAGLAVVPVIWIALRMMGICEPTTKKPPPQEARAA